MGADGQRATSRLLIDRSWSAGHACCAAVAPDLFGLNSDDDVAFGEMDVPAEAEVGARRGARACPERAITPIASEAG